MAKDLLKSSRVENEKISAELNKVAFISIPLLVNQEILEMILYHTFHKI